MPKRINAVSRLKFQLSRWGGGVVTDIMYYIQLESTAMYVFFYVNREVFCNTMTSITLFVVLCEPHYISVTALEVDTKPARYVSLAQTCALIGFSQSIYSKQQT